MTRNQSQVFRFLLFLAGAGIIVLAFYLFKGDRKLNSTDAFVWMSIAVMYLVFSIPFFFSAIDIARFSGKIPVLPLVWLGVILYIAASILIIALLSALRVISLNSAIIFQSVLLFLFFIDIYFAYFASSHAGNVAAEEAVKQQFLSQIKSKARVLSLSANNLPQEYEKVQKILKRALEDIVYLYPVNGGAGDDLESQILQSLETLSQICSGITAGTRSPAADKEAANLQMLVNERKLLRN
jgi:hypothetical protein